MRLVSSDFERFSTNWLLIYDNLPLPNPDPILSLKYLSRNIRPYWFRSPRFDSIYVESGDEIFRLMAFGEVRLLQNKIGKTGR